MKFFRTPERVWYHLENGQKIFALRVGESKLSSLVIINLSSEPGYQYVGKEGWFSREWFEHWRGMVPDWCDQGIDPGQWSEMD